MKKLILLAALLSLTTCLYSIEPSAQSEETPLKSEKTHLLNGEDVDKDEAKWAAIINVYMLCLHANLKNATDSKIPKIDCAKILAYLFMNQAR